MLSQVEGRRARGVRNGNESRLASEKEEEESMYITLNSDAASGARIKNGILRKKNRRKKIFTHKKPSTKEIKKHSAVPFIEVSRERKKKHKKSFFGRSRGNFFTCAEVFFETF